jgi:hypothetical protein
VPPGGDPPQAEAHAEHGLSLIDVNQAHGASLLQQRVEHVGGRRVVVDEPVLTRASPRWCCRHDALTGNWFAQFSLELEARSAMRHVDHTARLGDQVLFQWAGKDVYIGQDVRDAYAASSPDAEVRFYERSDHEFRDDARVDRLAFLEAQLGL